MVTKKELIKRIDFLTKMIGEQDNTIKELSEKVLFLYRQSGIEKEHESLFDEWMNGKQEEGEK